MKKRKVIKFIKYYIRLILRLLKNKYKILKIKDVRIQRIQIYLTNID